MSLHDEITAAQRALDELTASVGRMEQRIGAGLDIRRVRTDTERLRESLAVLGEGTVSVPPPASSAPPVSSAADRPGHPGRQPEMVTIPDTPYDSSLWTDAEEEGLGAHDRHAP